MARIQPLLSNFSWGEMSPIMQGRTDLTQVKSSCQILENFYVDSHGGIRRRRGTQFANQTKYPQLESRLIPFIFSQEQSWMLEFGDYYIRFFRDGGVVINPGAVEFYRGDGVAVNFFYDHDSVAESDIEVYVEPNFDIPGDAIPHDTTTVPPAAVELGKVRIEPLAAGQSYAPNFRDADWAYTDFSIGAGATDVVSDGVATRASLALAAQPISIGAIVNISVDIVDTQYTPDQAIGSSLTDQPLVSDAPPISVLDFTPAIGSHDNVLVTYTVTLEDASPTGRTSNFDYFLTRNGQTIDSGTALDVGAPQQILVQNIPVVDLVDTDEFSVEVQASGNHNQSQPQVSGSVNLTQISVDYDKGRGGNVYFTLSTNKTTPQTYTRPADQLGTWTLGTLVQVSAREFSIKIDVDPWLVTTLDNILVDLAESGYDVQFATDIVPADNALILIRDGSQPPPEAAATSRTGSALAVGEVFEIPSPWSADEVKDLHYVQANDIMYLVHERHHPRELKRYSAYDWRVEQPDFNQDGPEPGVTSWVKPAWADPNYDPLLGYPRTVQFFQQRLVFGGTESQPQTIWGSRVADFLIFAYPDGSTSANDPLPDSAVELTIAAQTQEAIQWMASSRALFIGTTGNEHRVTVNSFLAVDNLPDVTRQSQYGGRHIQPEFIGTAVMFVQTAGLEIRTYDLDRNANVEFYDSLNAAWLAEHITQSGVVNLAFWKTPYSILWCTRADGVALTMTYDPSVVDIEEDLLPVGWARHITKGKFEWIASMPGGVGERALGTYQQSTDEVWTIVNRTIEGQNLRYVEHMPEANYLDSSISASLESGESATWGGAEHLAGETVSVVAQGAVHPDVVVQSDGTFTLNYPVSQVTIGLPYTSKMKSSKFEDGNPSGTGQSAKIRWSKIFARIDVSAIPKINGQQAAIRHPSTPMDTAEPLFTGDVEVSNLGIDYEGSVEIETDHPYPVHVLALFGQLGINAG